MIREILDTLKNKLEEYLTAYFNSPEGYVQIGGIPVGSDNAPNKLSLSVVNLERETAMGIGFRLPYGQVTRVCGALTRLVFEYGCFVCFGI